MSAPSRRGIPALLSSARALANRSLLAQAPAGPAKGLVYADVQPATALAKQPFDAESAKIPAELSNLSHDSYLNGVRAIVDATLQDGQSAELRMFVKTRNRTLSETRTTT